MMRLNDLDALLAMTKKIDLSGSRQAVSEIVEPQLKVASKPLTEFSPRANMIAEWAEKTKPNALVEATPTPNVRASINQEWAKKLEAKAPVEATPKPNARAVINKEWAENLEAKAPVNQASSSSWAKQLRTYTDEQIDIIAKKLGKTREEAIAFTKENPEAAVGIALGTGAIGGAVVL